MSNSESIGFFFKTQGQTTSRCWGPDEGCTKRSINAHSIPSASVLTQLARDGHVITSQIKLQAGKPSEISFNLVGVKKASTFTGLCADHDSAIFKPIDVSLPDLGKEEHLFLLTYRAVLREFHVCMQNGWRNQAVYLHQVKLGLLPANEPSDLGLFAMECMGVAFECYEYKSSLDQNYRQKQFSNLQHRTITLVGQEPTIAVSSMFSLDEIDAPTTPRVMLSIFPSNGNVSVVFTATPDDAPYVFTHLARILQSDGDYQKYLLSKLILQSCDNLVIAPEYYDSLSAERRNVIGQFYVATLRENLDDFEDERLFLF